ncbi:TPA: hypothetical protein HH295_14970 [Xanthomonas vasicola pv. zeae]|uniref:DUF805 domain-containing protein n=1 Tax=Xanthomonas vasicola TaxID=56459 RepID=A0ABD7S2R8_XANVA|nr:hypothetical protein [Xanthomonas vasicola]MBV6747744.1 hypothetical protein [Xanthomonas vasicola pv. vasculorum NCPPB 890]MBV6893407.1 hypothetical protein [Xanthomonas vasicola pv. vasculorum]MBV7306791.1 hypothetical protein [Xanthomonas vasicola pv. vasculorum]MDO6936289.1 hypothetical protein [Xanthomonas vasicola]MDO6940210.1 hypothetical protein [Xanthomonas vasicola]
MQNFDKNLGRSAVIFLFGLLGSVLLASILAENGYHDSVPILVLWAVMPLVAWFMSRAVKGMGKNPWLYGVACLIPPMAVLFFIKFSVARQIDRSKF